MLNITPVKLSHGAHASPEHGLCLMEMVAFLNGEPHTDRPRCVCPTLINYGTTLNDAVNDRVRQKKLLPLVTKLIGTRCDIMMPVRAALLLNRTFNEIVMPFLYQADPECPSGKPSKDYFSELHARPKLFDYDIVLLPLIALGDFDNPREMARKAAETLSRMLYLHCRERQRIIPIAIDIFRACIEAGPHSWLDKAKVSERSKKLATLFA